MVVRAIGLHGPIVVTLDLGFELGEGDSRHLFGGLHRRLSCTAPAHAGKGATKRAPPRGPSRARGSRRSRAPGISPGGWPSPTSRGGEEGGRRARLFSCGG